MPLQTRVAFDHMKLPGKWSIQVGDEDILVSAFRAFERKHTVAHQPAEMGALLKRADRSLGVAAKSEMRGELATRRAASALIGSVDEGQLGTKMAASASS